MASSRGILNIQSLNELTYESAKAVVSSVVFVIASFSLPFPFAAPGG
jgi:hypothetical protein